jgi:hypothetical protein
MVIMLSKFAIFLLMIFSSIGVNSTVLDSQNQLVSFINDNIPEMRESYQNEFGVNWDVTEFKDYKKLYDIDENIYAYVIRFDTGYIVVTEYLELIEINIEGESPLINYEEKTYLFGNNYYVKTDEGYLSNGINTPAYGTIGGESLVISDIYYNLEDDRDDFDNFVVTLSLADDLEDQNGNYGEYSIYTRNQGSTTDCGPQAGVNLIYTYDKSGLTDIAKSNNSDTELNSMQIDMGWTSSGQSYLGLVFMGTWPSDFKSGLDDYMGSDYYMVTSALYDEVAPAVGLYYNANVTDTAHYALNIGRAQSDNWWIFKHNWDIISTWDENYYHTSSGVIGSKKSGTPSYHFVKRGYRQNTFALYESTPSGGQVVKID